VDPYRGELVRDEPRSLVAESEPAPRGVRVWAWSDGTLRMRLRSPQLGWRATLLAGGFVAMLGAVVAMLTGAGAFVVLGPIGGGLAVIATGGLRKDVPLEGERLELTPAAISWWRSSRSDTRALADLSTVVVTGVGADARLDLHFGLERLQLADGLGYDEATLRWIAQRLRRAIEASR